jgi:chitinase
VILEVAYWIGPTPGVAPTAANLATYGDNSHTVATDRWVVFHLHIGLDADTFYQGGNNQFNFYPGVTFMSVYHSQTLHPGTSNQAPRAEYIFSNSYSQRTNTGTMTNYNTRSQALDCNQQGTPTRWYIGRDNANAVAGLRTTGRPSDYAEAMNQFVCCDALHF